MIHFVQSLARAKRFTHLNFIKNKIKYKLNFYAESEDQMKNRPNLIVMLTNNDVTVKDAYEIFESCKDLDEVQYWGFKNVGLPKDEMKRLVQAMKAAGKTTYLEVVT